MKKLVGGCLACAMALTLCACGQTMEEKWMVQNQEAAALLAQGQEENAILAFSEALEIDPNQADSFLGRANAYMLRGTPEDLELAKSDYQKALALDDHAEEAYRKLAELYLEKEAMAEALEIYQQAAEVLGSAEFDEKAQQLHDWIQEQAWTEAFHLGTGSMLDGQYQKAAEAFTLALEADPENLETYIRRAEAYEQLEDHWKEAEADYRKALELDPNQEALYLRLCDLYRNSENTDAAIEILKKGVELFDSAAMKEILLELDPSQYSDEQLLQMVNEDVRYTYYFIGGMVQGAFFEQDFNQVILDENQQEWFPVVDERVHCVSDVEDQWYARFSRSYPVPDRVYEVYRDMDGKLYTNCQGIGGDIFLEEMVLTDVVSREGNLVNLEGYVLRRDPAIKEGDDTYKNTLLYSLEFENGVWKCAHFEEVQ